jgi:Skp family chaperone for outer membrane proteins
MKNKIILCAFLSTLIFITYAHAQSASSQKAEEIFPILKWLVSTNP